MNEFNYTQQQVAESIGISRVQVSNLIRLLQLPEAVQTMLEERKLNMGHARPLVGLGDKVALNLAQQCIEKGWSARQMEKQAKKASVPPKKVVTDVASDVLALEEELSRTLALPVKLQNKKDGSGSIKLSYANKQELNMLLKRLR
jgi:ParB family chromosome partitioning protein